MGIMERVIEEVLFRLSIQVRDKVPYQSSEYKMAGEVGKMVALSRSGRRQETITFSVKGPKPKAMKF